MKKQFVNDNNHDSYQKIEYKHNLSKMLLWIGLIVFSIILTMLIVTEGLTKGTINASEGLISLFFIFFIFVLIKSFIGLLWGFYKHKNYKDENLTTIDPKNFRNDNEKELYSMVSSLSVKAGLEKVPTVKIYNDNGEINAYAFSISRNNSLITIYRTSIEKLDKDELTAVIAHEIGHIVNGDALTSTLINEIFRSLIFIFLTIPVFFIKQFLEMVYKDSESTDACIISFAYNIIAIFEFLISKILWFFTSIVMNFHSRIREFEADRISAKLHNPESGIKLMNTLKVNNNPKSLKGMDNLSLFKINSPVSHFDFTNDHPNLDRRIQAIKEFQDAIANKRKPVNTEKAKEYKRAAILASLIILLLVVLANNNNMHKSSGLATNRNNSINYNINNNSVGSASSKVIATVNGKPITVAKFKQEMSKLPPALRAYLETTAGEKRLLKSLVDRQILLNEAIKEGINKSKSYESQVSDFKKGLLAKLLLHKEVANKVKVTNAYAKAYYKKHYLSFNLPSKINVSYIQLNSLKHARIVYKMLVGKKNFASMAKKYSTNPNGKSGGVLGWIKFQETTPVFNNAAFSISKVGGISKIVKVGKHFDIIKLNNVITGKPKPFSAIKGQIVIIMRQKEASKILKSLVKNLRKKSKVKYFYNNLPVANSTSNSSIPTEKTASAVGKKQD